MSDLQHGKEIVITSYYDGSVASIKHEYEIPVFSSKEGLLKDVIEALAVISSGETNKLTIEVCIDNKARYRLTKKWVA